MQTAITNEVQCCKRNSKASVIQTLQQQQMENLSVWHRHT